MREKSKLPKRCWRCGGRLEERLVPPGTSGRHHTRRYLWCRFCFQVRKFLKRELDYLVDVES